MRNPPPYPILPNGWPRDLPRFARTFCLRLFHLDHPTMHMVDTTWTHSAMWSRVVQDFGPMLARGAHLRFTASTIETLDRGRAGMAESYYGGRAGLQLHWHWQNATWECSSNAAGVMAYAEAYGVHPAIISWPAHEQPPHEICLR